MISKSILTTIIGFLFGNILFLVINSNSIIIFLFGGVGYFVGLMLDNADRKLQIDMFHFTNIKSSHEIFYSDLLPEAMIIFSAYDNITTVFLDYRIEAKPEDYRLSVLKNLQEFDFRVIEDSSKTIFSLSIEFPEFNYPLLLSSEKEMERFIHDIKERSVDFQVAIQKIIPGLVISIIKNPNIFGDQNHLVSNSVNSHNLKNPIDPDNGVHNPIVLSKNLGGESPTIPDESGNQTDEDFASETEEEIMSDLMGSFTRSHTSLDSKRKIQIKTTDSNENKSPKLLTADKIKEKGEEIIGLDKISERKLSESLIEERGDQVESEKGVTQESDILLESDEGEFEIIEGTLSEEEKPILTKVTEQIKLAKGKIKESIGSD